MGGTKFFVLQMRDLIKYGIIGLVGLILVILALVFLLPGSSSAGSGSEQPPPVPGAAATFNPGTYAATIILNNKPVEVRVTVDEYDILDVYMTDMYDIQRTFFPLFEPRMYDLAQEVLRHQSAHITPETDYPVTTGILHRAVQSALHQAAYDND